MKRINKKKFPIYLIIVLIFTILLIIGIFRSNLFDKKNNHSASVYVALISYDSADTQDNESETSSLSNTTNDNKNSGRQHKKTTKATFFDRLILTTYYV